MHQLMYVCVRRTVIPTHLPAVGFATASTMHGFVYLLSLVSRNKGIIHGPVLGGNLGRFIRRDRPKHIETRRGKQEREREMENKTREETNVVVLGF